MTARDELPEGWKLLDHSYKGLKRPFSAEKKRRYTGEFRATGDCKTPNAATVAAWRIVDAEKEAVSRE